MNLLGNARYSPHSLLTLGLEATQGGNLDTLKMKLSTNIGVVNGVNNYTKLGEKLE
jgi:hypothetical protein